MPQVLTNSIVNRLFLVVLTLQVIGQIPPTLAADDPLPIYAVEANNGYTEMLDTVGRRSLYLLGDASHGTREYYLFRQQVTRYLIEERGIRNLVWEAEAETVISVNHWINEQSSKPASANELLTTAFVHWPQWLWANQEVASFISWVREINQSQPMEDRVQIYGMDMQNSDTIAGREYQRLQSEDIYAGWNYRSGYMADAISAVVKSEGPTIVWAHNNHVADKVADDVKGTGLISMGQILRERFGSDQVFILGSAGYQGSLIAARVWGGPAEVMTLPPAIPDSLAGLLNTAGWENPLLFWEDEQQGDKWRFPIAHRGVGVVMGEEQDDLDNYVNTQTSRRYDAIVFWANTTPIRPL